jgi:hypothetical protein
MSDTMIERAARVDPVPAGAFDDLADTPWGRATLDAIVAAPASKARGIGRRPAVSWALTLGAAGAAAVIAAGVVVATGDGPAPRSSSGPDRPPAGTTEELPRLLITAPGWRIARAWQTDTSAEITFENGRRWIDLNWYPGRLFEDYVADRRREADATSRVVVAGHEAFVFRHDGNAPIGVTFYALWRDGSYAVELRTDVIPTGSEFEEIARSFERVDEDTWLAAMPPRVVTPDERREAIERIVADMSLPPGFDLEELADRQVVTDSLDFGIASAVVCGWIDHWVEADRRGDESGRREAAEALAGAHRWRAVADNSIGAGYVDDVADAMATGEPVLGERSRPVGAGYRRHVGCD